MNATLRERLIRAEQLFLLSVVSNDEESLKHFFQEWSQLAQDIASVKVAGHLDDDTALLLSRASRAVENMAGFLLESGAILQEFQTRSISEFIQDILSDPSSITSPPPQAIAPYHLLFSNIPSSTTPAILGQQKLLDSYAYRWLMQNIHNPYPSSVQTQIISDVSGTSIAQVELWFQEIRDSIGWNKLSHNLFAGSVNATVAAARRVYLERDKDISFDIVFAFKVVKASAETLFSEHPALQGKNAKTASAQANHTVVMDQYHHMGPFPGESMIEPEGIIVPPQVNPLAPLDPFSDLSDSDESEEEDITPPPPIAGRKRPLTEDVLTSQVYDTGKLQKRRRTSIDWTPYSGPECPTSSSSPVSSPLKSILSSEQTMPTGFASLVSCFPSLHSSPISPESLPGLPPVAQKRTCVGLEEATSEGATTSLPTHISAHGVRKRKLSQCVSPIPSKRQCLPSVLTRKHCTAHSAPSFDRCPDLCPFQSGPTDPKVPQSTLQISVNSDTPANFGVFDWNSIPDPLAEMAPSLSQPAVVYVPGSDLTSQLLEPQDFGPDAKTSRSLVDLGPLGDLGSLLQFSTPPGWTPDLSTSFSTLPRPGCSPLPPQDFNWSSISEFIDSFTPDSTQSLTSSGVSPLPSESSQELLYQSQYFNSTQQASSVLDPSVPPSVFLPLESDSFSENMDDMWSFLRDGS